mgnify:FL=1
MNESIGIQSIHIRFSTNANGDTNQILTQNMIFIPPKEDDDDNEQNSDTTSEKENTSKKESYPFFTDQVRLSVSKLLKMPRQKQIDVFFIKEDFKKLIGSSYSTDLDERNENAEHNLRVMVQIFFPTVFPINGNITETFSEKMKDTFLDVSIGSNNTNVATLLTNFFGKENEYGYLNIGKQYSVTKITFINDIINDPTFKNLIQPSLNFQNWRKETMNKYSESSGTFMNTIKTLIKTHFNNIKTALTDNSTDAYKDFIKIQNPSAQVNAQASHPPRLQVPYLETLLKTDASDVSKIIDLFIEIYKLNDAAPSDKPNYIPYSIKTLPGFNELLETSIKYKVDNEIQKTITNMEVAINYLTKIKEKYNFNNYVEKLVSEKIKTFTPLETFKNMISKFRSPMRSYSNKQLSILFNETSKDIQPFIEFIDFLRNVVIEDKPKDEYLSNTSMIDKMKTGVMTIREKTNDSDKKDEKVDVLQHKTKAYYDCFVNFELIDGLLNDTNLDLIKCDYRNDFLVTIYNDLKTNENKNPMLFYNNIPVFNMAKYTQKNRSNSEKKLGGFVPKDQKSIRSVKKVDTPKSYKSPHSISPIHKKKYTRRRRKNRRHKYSLNSRKYNTV